jgi:hypothetical protein
VDTISYKPEEYLDEEEYDEDEDEVEDQELEEEVADPVFRFKPDPMAPNFGITV